MMNRRDVLSAVVPAACGLSAGLAASVLMPNAKPASSPGPEFLVHKYVELPLQPGDEIVAMTMFRDELIVVTKHGEIFRLQPSTYY